MKKNVKHINESQLRAIVTESVKRVLKEDDNCGLSMPKPQFQTKGEAIEWIKNNISDERQAQLLISALEDFLNFGFLHHRRWNQ